MTLDSPDVCDLLNRHHIHSTNVRQTRVSEDAGRPHGWKDFGGNGRRPEMVDRVVGAGRMLRRPRT